MSGPPVKPLPGAPAKPLPAPLPHPGAMPTSNPVPGTTPMPGGAVPMTGTNPMPGGVVPATGSTPMPGSPLQTPGTLPAQIPPLDPNSPEAVAQTIKAVQKPLIKVDINGHGAVKMFAVESSDTFHDLCLRVAEKENIPPEEAKSYYLFLIDTNKNKDTAWHIPVDQNSLVISYLLKWDSAMIPTLLFKKPEILVVRVQFHNGFKTYRCSETETIGSFRQRVARKRLPEEDDHPNCRIHEHIEDAKGHKVEIVLDDNICISELVKRFPDNPKEREKHMFVYRVPDPPEEIKPIQEETKPEKLPKADKDGIITHKGTKSYDPAFLQGMSTNASDGFHKALVLEAVSVRGNLRRVELTRKPLEPSPEENKEYVKPSLRRVQQPATHLADHPASPTSPNPATPNPATSDPATSASPAALPPSPQVGPKPPLPQPGKALPTPQHQSLPQPIAPLSQSQPLPPSQLGIAQPTPGQPMPQPAPQGQPETQPLPGQPLGAGTTQFTAAATPASRPGWTSGHKQRTQNKYAFLTIRSAPADSSSPTSPLQPLGPLGTVSSPPISPSASTGTPASPSVATSTPAACVPAVTLPPGTTASPMTLPPSVAVPPTILPATSTGSDVAAVAPGSVVLSNTANAGALADAGKQPMAIPAAAGTPGVGSPHIIMPASMTANPAASTAAPVSLAATGSGVPAGTPGAGSPRIIMPASMTPNPTVPSGAGTPGVGSPRIIMPASMTANPAGAGSPGIILPANMSTGGAKPGITLPLGGPQPGVGSPTGQPAVNPMMPAISLPSNLTAQPAVVSPTQPGNAQPVSGVGAAQPQAGTNPTQPSASGTVSGAVPNPAVNPMPAVTLPNGMTNPSGASQPVANPLQASAKPDVNQVTPGAITPNTGMPMVGQPGVNPMMPGVVMPGANPMQAGMKPAINPMMPGVQLNMQPNNGMPMVNPGMPGAVPGVNGANPMQTGAKPAVNPMMPGIGMPGGSIQPNGMPMMPGAGMPGANPMQAGVKPVVNPMMPGGCMQPMVGVNPMMAPLGMPALANPAAGTMPTAGQPGANPMQPNAMKPVLSPVVPPAGMPAVSLPNNLMNPSGNMAGAAKPGAAPVVSPSGMPAVTLPNSLMNPAQPGVNPMQPMPMMMPNMMVGANGAPMMPMMIPPFNPAALQAMMQQNKAAPGAVQPMMPMASQPQQSVVTPNPAAPAAATQP